MPSLKLEEIEEIASSVISGEDSELYDRFIGAITNKLIEKQNENKESRSPKKPNKEWIVFSDPLDKTVFIAQVGEDENGTLVQDVKEAVLKAAGDYNSSKKGEKNPVFNMYTLFTSAKKMLKCNGIYVKSKDSVDVVEIRDVDIQG